MLSFKALNLSEFFDSFQIYLATYLLRYNLIFSFWVTRMLKKGVMLCWSQ